MMYFIKVTHKHGFQRTIMAQVSGSSPLFRLYDGDDCGDK